MGIKKVTLKTSIPPHMGGANHIKVTAAKIQLFFRFNYYIFKLLVYFCNPQIKAK